MADPLSALLVATFLAPLAPVTNRIYEEARLLPQHRKSLTDVRQLTGLIPPTNHVFEVAAAPVADLRDPLLTTLDFYSELEAGWDGPKSRAASNVAIEAAKTFVRALPAGLRIPVAMMSLNGEPGFYWSLSGGYADVSFDEKGLVSFFSRDAGGAERFEDALQVEALNRDWFFNHVGSICAPVRAAA